MTTGRTDAGFGSYAYEQAIRSIRSIHVDRTGHGQVLAQTFRMQSLAGQSQ
jgi:hypothetical protein